MARTDVYGDLWVCNYSQQFVRENRECTAYYLRLMSLVFDDIDGTHSPAGLPWGMSQEAFDARNDEYQRTQGRKRSYEEVSFDSLFDTQKDE